MKRHKSQFAPVTPVFCTGNHTGSGGVGDLPTTVIRLPNNSSAIGSTWVISSVRERIRFLFSGKISITIMGQGMPPLAVNVGDLDVKR